MVTIKKIAQDLNLSVSAVSRALSPVPERVKLVNSRHRKMIIEAAAFMGYKRNRQAEFMQRGRNAAIGVFVPEICDSQMCNLMFGIAETAFSHGFPVNFHPGIDAKSYEAFIRANLNNPSAGIISYPPTFDQTPHTAELLHKYHQGHGRILLLNTTVAEDGIPSLNMDETYGGKLAAQTLKKHDCQIYLHCASTKHVSKMRITGFTEELSGNRINSIPRCAKLDFWQNKLKSYSRIGIFARHDLAAGEYIRQLRQAGADFGKNVFIVGYDNSPLSEVLDPALTSIKQPFREQGRKATEILLSLIYGKNENTPIETMKPSLIKRDSA
ncbi:MAG: LacI family DNA-binding transcriptional regulator [Victivallales bacterium]